MRYRQLGPRRGLGTQEGDGGGTEFGAGHTLVAAGDVPLVDADPEGVSGCEPNVNTSQLEARACCVDRFVEESLLTDNAASDADREVGEKLLAGVCGAM